MSFEVLRLANKSNRAVEALLSLLDRNLRLTASKQVVGQLSRQGVKFSAADQARYEKMLRFGSADYMAEVRRLWSQVDIHRSGEVARNRFIKFLGEIKLVLNPDMQKADDFLKLAAVTWDGQMNADERTSDLTVKVNAEFAAKYQHRDEPM